VTDPAIAIQLLL